jgi:CrcB protein
VDRRLLSIFPYGTLVVNITGSFLLGVILAWAAKKTGTHADEWKLFLGTGFCGGFTTFSAFAAENLVLFEQKLTAAALLYILASIVGGLVAVWLGFAVSRAMF